MNVNDPQWDETVRLWAERQGDIRALVQIGSRAQNLGLSDQWSDFDYQLITTRPKKYRDGSFASEISPCWCYNSARAFGGVVKVSAVYTDAKEADFVILNALEVRIAAAVLRFPKTRPIWPRPLQLGVGDLQRVAGEGWKMVKGGSGWSHLYRRFKPYRRRMEEKRFSQINQAFWTKMIWVGKKVLRGEFLAARRGFHEGPREYFFELLEEYGLLQGHSARPEGRRIEHWLAQDFLEILGKPTVAERGSFLATLKANADLYDQIAKDVARQKEWAVADFDQSRNWVQELA